MQTTTDHILDLRGMIVPVTLLNISRSLQDIPPGETVEIVGSDPETRRLFFKILRAFPFELLEVSDEQSGYRVRLRKYETEDSKPGSAVGLPTKKKGCIKKPNHISKGGKMMKKKSIVLMGMAFLILCFYHPVLAQDTNPAEKTKPVNLTFFDPVQIFNADASITGFRLNLLYGVNRDMTGLDLGVGNQVNGNMKGWQIGAADYVEGGFMGAQMGAANIVQGSAIGSQTSALNLVGGDAKGCQISAANVVCGSAAGLQIGATNIVKSDFQGCQISAANVVCGSAAGLQIGAYNYGESFCGMQLAAINHTKKFSGLAIGAINYTEVLDGLQIGALNFNWHGGPLKCLPVVNFAF